MLKTASMRLRIQVLEQQQFVKTGAEGIADLAKRDKFVLWPGVH